MVLEVIKIYHFELLNVEERFKNTLPVESSKLKDKRNRKGGFVDNRGLFSEVVFGTTHDFSCACGRYKGIMCQGIVCEHCGVMVQSSEARRNTFGKIDLGPDVFLVNPVAFKLLTTNCLNDKNLKNHAHAVLIGREWVSKTTGEISKTYIDNCYTGPHAFRDKIYPKIVESIKDNNSSDYIINVTLPKIDECLFTHLIPIIPPDLRPIISGAGNTSFIDEVNKYYMIMRNYVTYINNSPILPYDKIAVLQNQYFQVSDLLLKKLSSKSGIMRKYLLAKRVDYSARAVIVPDYTLNIDQVDVSFHIIKEVFKPTLLPKLAAKLNISELEALNRYDSFEYENILFELCQSYRNYPVIINRQPTLHRASIMVFFIRNIVRDYVLVVPPIACEPFNADFDGDQMALYFPIGGASYNEALNLVPSKNIFLPSNGELAFGFAEDLVLGLYKLSMTEEGIKKIFDIIPEDAHYLIKDYRNEKFTGKVLNKVLSILIDKLPPQTFTNMINNLAHLSHAEAKLAISLTDYANAKNDDNDLNNPVSLMVLCGARGNWTQVRQINETRGFISDVEGKVIPSIINSSLLHGLTPHEYFVSCYGGLKGLIDSSRNTSISGYLTRRLIYLTSNIELSENEMDCGSTNYLKLHLDEDLIKMFMYRVVKLDPDDKEEYIITKDNYTNFIDKDIYLRSPMTCLCKNGYICHKCYGYLFKKHNSRQIGYIAAQSIGERAAQLTLRTKHTSGATNISLPDWVNIEQGFIVTSVPTVIVVNSNGNTITNLQTNEEVDLPYSTIDIICENYKHEIIHDSDDDIDPTSKNEMYDDDEDELFDMNSIDTTNKYIIDDVGKIATISINSHDVVAAVSEFGKYLKKLPKYVTEDMSLSDVLLQLIDKLGITNIHSIHYELLLSIFARSAENPSELYRNHQDGKVLWFKENETLDNMLVNSMVFERFNSKLPKLLISDPNDLNWKSSIFMQLTSFNFGSKFIHSDPKLDNLFGHM